MGTYRSTRRPAGPDSPIYGRMHLAMTEPITDFELEVLRHLDDDYVSLRVIADRCGYTLSGSGWETAADSLVVRGLAQMIRDPHAPMGKRYRRSP